MNNTNCAENTEFSLKRTKKILRGCVILTTLVLFGISCFLLSPMYVMLSSNILYRGGFAANLVNILNNVLYLAVYAVCFSTIIYSVYRCGTRSSLSLVMIYAAAIFLRYVANIIVQAFIDGALPLFAELYPTVFGFIFDFLTVLGVLLIAHLCLSSVNRLPREKKRNLLPFDKLFSLSNPIQRSAFFTGILLATIKVATRVVYDIGYGAPTSALEILRMAVYYLSDVLICAVIYLFSLLVILSIHKKDNQP